MNALDERFRRSGHRAVVSQIVLKLRAITLHDFGACRGVGVIEQHEQIAENGIAAIDIDYGLALELSRRSGALVTEAAQPGLRMSFSFHGPAPKEAGILRSPPAGLQASKAPIWAEPARFSTPPVSVGTS